ncbi:MAG: hypothetical protein ACI9TV_000351 [Sulfurimonas sp.]|jgi:hypothetical protein
MKIIIVNLIKKDIFFILCLKNSIAIIDPTVPPSKEEVSNVNSDILRGLFT